MHYPEETNSSSFTLNESLIEEAYEFCDLGLPSNHHLSWNSHVDAINKVNRILGLLRRTCTGWKDIQTLKVLAVLYICEIANRI